MIARLVVALPFNVAVPEGAKFNVYTYEDEGCHVSVYPPGRSDDPVLADIPEDIKINGTPGFIANGLRVDFRKEKFDRRRGQPWDPSEALLQRTVDWFLTRFRYVTRAQQVHPLQWSQVSWRLRYLQDDESEFEEDEDFVRGYAARAIRLSIVGVNPDVWDQIHSLDADYAPPPWDSLRLDAIAALPSVGTAIVLAATCLEVFISYVLEKLVAKSDMPGDVWNWINDRGDWLKNPTTDEQFDILLRLLGGHSLKEEKSLWEAFKNLRKARNSFVHEGAAKIGDKAATEADARRLVASAESIIDWVKQWLPAEARWPEFEAKITMSVEKQIL
jgi:hypothetical protein